MRYFLLLFVLVFSGCEDALLKETFDNTPTGNYDAFWSEFDRFYGAFEAKHINWDSVKVASVGGLNDSSTDAELFQALSRLLASLNDGHASLTAPGIGEFSSWSRRNKSFFVDVNSLSSSQANQIFTIITSTYMRNVYYSDVSSGYFFFYGTIHYHNKNMGYLFIPTFNGKNFPKDFIYQAAAYLKSCDALVIDLRFNSGGTTSNFTYALDMFTTESRLYLTSKLRDGKKHSDFTDFIMHYTNPDPSACKNKAIAILANSYTGSSAEHFILGLKSQDNVILVGDTTRGAFSEVHQRILPNGWIYQIGAQVVYTPERNLFLSSKGQYIEGHGLEPDYYSPDYYKGILMGVDYPLNKALLEIEKRIP
jgi:carboxyl-terminal processing protease